MQFERYEIPKELYVSWEALHQEVPQRIKDILRQLEHKTGPIFEAVR